jgi:outer membrane protein assembly factor BamE
MYKSIICLLLMLTISSCSLIHRQTIEQGNIIKPENVSQLHTGMSENQVRNVMGNPVLINIFTPNQIVYVYTIRSGQGQFRETRVTCIFERGRLKQIQR